jgi:hypothetical protein
VKRGQGSGFVWWKAKVDQPALAALVHVGLKTGYGIVAAGDGLWWP